MTKWSYLAGWLSQFGAPYVATEQITDLPLHLRTRQSGLLVRWAGLGDEWVA